MFLVRLVGGGGVLLDEGNGTSSSDDAGDTHACFFAMKVLRKTDVARRHQVGKTIGWTVRCMYTYG